MLAILLLTVLQNLNIKGRAKPLCPHPFRWTTKTRDVPNYFIWIWISLFVPDVPVPTPYLSLSLGHSIPCLSNPRRMQTYCPLQFDFESILVNVSILQFVSKVFLCQVFLLSCLNGKFFRYLISNLPGNKWTFLP